MVLLSVANSQKGWSVNFTAEHGRYARRAQSLREREEVVIQIPATASQRQPTQMDVCASIPVSVPDRLDQARQAREPEYRRTIEERRLPGGRISGTFLIAFGVPVLATIMWFIFVVIAF